MATGTATLEAGASIPFDPEWPAPARRASVWTGLAGFNMLVWASIITGAIALLD